jgi:DNA-3-methyladenine glycosylase II
MRLTAISARRDLYTCTTREVADSRRHLPPAEEWLCSRDHRLRNLIEASSNRWTSIPTEDSVAGLIRIVMSQQVSTHVACTYLERALLLCPSLAAPSGRAVPAPAIFRQAGLSEARARCCVSIVKDADRIREGLRCGLSCEDVLGDFKGIGPWTLTVFRILVLREPDVLAIGDLGLIRAITKLYGRRRKVENLAKAWRPYRSVACWYLWRSLGNEPLG